MATANPITRYRQAERAIAGIARNHGRTRATTDALHRWWHQQDQALRVLLTATTQGDDQARYIAGLLTEESKLRCRDWQHRPELKSRMLNVRRDLQRLEKELDQ
jgi:hypothetical protein